MQNNRLYPVLINIIIVVLSFLTIPNTFAGDNTKVGLPEGAIARFGKGGINKQTLSKFDFAPNGIMEAVAFSQDAKFYATQENRWNFALDPLRLNQTNRCKYVK